MDMEDCIVYLVWQLRQSGFEVRFTWPNLLFISWRHHEGDYLTKHNPIIQAMIPEPIAPPKPSQKSDGPKKRGAAPNGHAQQAPKVSFSDIELLTSPSYGQGTAVTAYTGPAAQQQRRAMDYEPPASFLQNMERPVKTNPKGNVLADLWSFN